MFKDGNREGGETVIGPSVKVEGNFVGEGDVIVEGQVSGSLKTSRNLHVGESATIRAEVEASNLTLSGEIRGNVKVADKLEVAATAKIYGNIETKVLTVAPGAVLNGKLSMRGSERFDADAEGGDGASTKEGRRAGTRS